MKSSAGTVEPGDGIVFTREASTTVTASTTVNVDYSTLGSAVGLYEYYPIILQKSFLYEDGTACTSINFKIYSPSSMYETPIVDEDVADTVQLEEMTANTLTDGQVTFTLVAGSGLPHIWNTSNKTIRGIKSWMVMLSVTLAEQVLVSGTQVRFPTSDNYLTGSCK